MSRKSQNPFQARRPWTLVRVAGTCACLAAVMLSPGCSKPPPPPPPAPAPTPPPPPPAEVQLETLAQDLKVDPRVQFASGVHVTEDRIELGRAVVKLADALAKGDAKAMRPLLEKRAQAVLDELDSTGGWTEATQGIEAVRVLLIQDGLDLSSAPQAPKDTSGELFTKLRAEVRTALKDVPEAQQSLVFQALAKALVDVRGNPTPEGIEGVFTGLAETAKSAGVSEDILAQLDAMKATQSAAFAAAQASAAPAIPTGSSTGVLVAVQDSKGAYLLGWGAVNAGNEWVFVNAPATAEIRPRASLFDGIGSAGFEQMKLAASAGELEPAPTGPGDASSGGGGGGGSSGGGGGSPPPSAPPSPTKPTPAGPIRRPGG